jgi:hypothetical protein
LILLARLLDGALLTHHPHAPLAGEKTRKFTAGRECEAPHRKLSLEWKGKLGTANGLVVVRLRIVAEGGGGGPSYKGADWIERLERMNSFVRALGHRPTEDDVEDDWCPCCSGPHVVEDMVECDGCDASYHLSCAASEGLPVGDGPWLCKQCSAS